MEGTLTDPGTDLHVPSLCDVEVAAALRRLELSGVASASRMQEALQDYRDFPLTRHGHAPLLERIYALRHNVSSYDAAYVALAEDLDAPLLTADRRLDRAARVHTGVELI